MSDNKLYYITLQSQRAILFFLFVSSWTIWKPFLIYAEVCMLSKTCTLLKTEQVIYLKYSFLKTFIQNNSSA